MLKNSLKVSDTSKTEFPEMISFQSEQKICQKYRHGDLSNLLDH